nr:LysM peptidoglycan-binding domain-containing protein [Nitrospinaceae bacterium]NIR55683.1 LysM peptidoglycan-binding domain-containing protein [Nitrospinaceae bacterium]NIS86127.1 LysM peptidoglycan-binding domain-containing protein [Nitrospinaceae bacterium]NIT82971.1 LysM peptidoglycan-binding domain-containing protein [Nitrospinaceae bacterium]NIU45174.1 LysM peptidoglycan-binding domain-containing protein [Nitrospinaceae bacterium]
SEESRNSKVGIITVDFDETLSHYAEWAGLSVRTLRRINNIRSRSSALPIHKKIKVPFTRVDPETFEERRQEFHKTIQEDFFNHFRVSKLIVRNVRRGETLWELCNKMNFIPFWLLASYNPEKDIHSLSVGEPLVIPIITPIKPDEAPAAYSATSQG